MAKSLKGPEVNALKEAHEQVEDQEASISITPRAGAGSSGSGHRGCRRFSHRPKTKDVKTAIGAARAKSARKEML